LCGCANSRTYYLHTIEQTVLSGLRAHLVDPRAIRHFLKTYHDERKRLAASAGNRLPVLQRRLGEVTRQAARLKAWSEAVLNAYLKAGGVWPPRPYEAPIKKYYRSKRIGES
jgi:hypothetical protein